MDKSSDRVEILPGPEALARHVAEWMTSAALAAKGPFRVSLSGGSTPKILYRLLTSHEFSGAATQFSDNFSSSVAGCVVTRPGLYPISADQSGEAAATVRRNGEHRRLR
jgi:hypothetical protein